MKQTIAIAIMLITTAISAKAAKAYPGTLLMTQSDGTQIEVRLHGDEHFHWYATSDGALLSRIGSDFFVASVDGDGQLVPTAIMAHSPEKRGAEERLTIAAQNRELFFSKASQAAVSSRKHEPLGTSTPSYFPHTGTPKAVVVLVEFSDTKFTVSNPETVFDEYLNAEQLNDYGHGESYNYGSVAQYFSDMSFGQFRPQFDIYGPITLENTAAYYGKNSSSTHDVNFSTFLKDAANAADDIVDFSRSDYDSDSDGYVDLVYFIYAGYGESNGADESTIWPKSGTQTIGTFDGKNVCRYGVNNELNMYPDYSGFDYPQINGVGLFCHEFSHTMGLPDLYPTVTAAQVDNQEMEYWSLMDGGEYVYYGYYPTAYTAWERETMGWKSITELSADSHLDMTPLDNGGYAAKFCNTEAESEYMVMEVIENSGWNTKIPGHGLLVYHVCWPSDNVTLAQHPNNTAGKPGMAVVPADGLLISAYNDDHTTKEYRNSHKGDPFPGTSAVTTLSASQSLPNYTWQKGSDTTVPQGLKNISENTNSQTVSLDFYIDYATGISSAHDEAPQPSAIYDIQGRKQAPASAAGRGIYIIDKEKKVILK